MSELSGLVSCDSGQELARSAGTPAQPLVFLSQPPYEVGVDASEGHGQLGLVESPVVVDPALHDRVDVVGKVLEGRASAPVKSPAADCESDGLEAGQKVTNSIPCLLIAGRGWNVYPKNVNC